VVQTPLLGKPYGLVIAHGLNPVLNTLDPYWGSVWAAAEAVSNLTCVGGDYRESGLIDNFIWPVPDESSLADLDRAVDACVDVADALRRPFISGKDSLSSTYRFPDGTVLKIPPVLCVSVFGRIADVALTTTSALKSPGGRLYLVGARDLAGMGGSAYHATRGLSGGMPPQVDLGTLPRTLDAVGGAIRSGAVRACHDVSEGGLLACLAEMAFGGGLGAEVDLHAASPGGRAARLDQVAFNETAGVFVVELAGDTDAAETFGDVPHAEIGRVLPEPELRATASDLPLFGAPLGELQAAWEAPFRTVFH
jgi:phosphoribosylformylglycinamidine synthase